MLDSEAFSAALFVTELLDHLGVPYVVGGSVASTVHGIVRSTLDVDLVADLQLEHISSLVAGLGDDFYADEPSIRRAVVHRSSFNLIHLGSMTKIDVFVAGSRPFNQQQLARRIPGRVSPDSEETLWLLTAEDVILAKLDWFRLGGGVSERQWRDVLGVIQTQGDRLDLEYLRRWAKELGIGELLEQALTQSAN